MNEPPTPPRWSNDGKPFYCVVCGTGWGNYIMCDSDKCQLEPEAEAVKRYERWMEAYNRKTQGEKQ